MGFPGPVTPEWKTRNISFLLDLTRVLRTKGEKPTHSKLLFCLREVTFDRSEKEVCDPRETNSFVPFLSTFPPSY